MATEERNHLAALHHELGIPPNYATERTLLPYREAADSELVDIGLNPDGRPLRLVAGAASAWHGMRAGAAADGVALVAISGFRSLARQTEIIREKLASGKAIDEILRRVAAPGFSEHHTGRALDIAAPDHLELEEEFANTPAFRWLERHASRFGFSLSFPRGNPHGIVYEPWHWCWKP